MYSFIAYILLKKHSLKYTHKAVLFVFIWNNYLSGLSKIIKKKPCIS